MKFLIAGLGNIGEKYTNTRHNIGFKILDTLAEESRISFIEEKHAFRSIYKFKSRQFILIKPTTYMNLSGKAINYWLQKEKIKTDNLLIITDDISLPFGYLRLRKKGSDGGHNGLTDIIDSLKTTEFSRLRFGIDKNFTKGKQSEYVLSDFNENEKNNLNLKISDCIGIIKNFGTIGAEKTMSLIKNK